MHAHAGPDYLSALVVMFTQRLSEVPGMAGFYSAIPAVSMAWLDSRLLAKERLSHGRKAAAPDVGSDVAGFMDDGFAFGVAFMLQVSDRE